MMISWYSIDTMIAMIASHVSHSSNPFLRSCMHQDIIMNLAPRPKAILIMIAGIAFVILGIYHGMVPDAWGGGGQWVTDKDGNSKYVIHGESTTVNMEQSERMCPAMYDPVCGSDGRTHPSWCGLDDDGIEVAYPGECVSDEDEEIDNLRKENGLLKKQVGDLVQIVMEPLKVIQQLVGM